MTKLNRFKIGFNDIYNYATQQPQTFSLEQAIAHADQDRAESNLQTIKQYRYIYCESNNTFASQVGREVSTSAKNYGILGLEAAAVGIGAGVGALVLSDDKSSVDLSSAVTPSSSAKALAILSIGGVALGGVVGGAHAIYTRSQHRLLTTPEEKERVVELERLAQQRVAMFNRAQNEANPDRNRTEAVFIQRPAAEANHNADSNQESKNNRGPQCAKC